MLHGRFRPLVTTAGVYLFIVSILRLVLWGAFGHHFGVSFLQLPVALVIGLLNDLVVLPPLLLPLSFLLMVVPSWPKESYWRRLLAHIISTAVIFGFVYLAIAQYFFFDEFNGRFNLVSVDYLIYPNEVFVNIWETYHVIWFILATAVISIVTQIIFASRLVRSGMPFCRFGDRLKFVGLHLLLTVLALLVFSTDSLSVFTNHVANEITANGISSFFRALHTNELDFKRYYRTIPSKTAFTVMQKELRLDGQQRDNSSPLTDLNRSFPGRPDGLGQTWSDPQF